MTLDELLADLGVAAPAPAKKSGTMGLRALMGQSPVQPSSPVQPNAPQTP